MGRKGKKPNKSGPAGVVATSMTPSPVMVKPKYARVFRFKNTGASTVTIARGDVLSLIVAVSATGTACMFPIDAIRVKRVKIWTIGTAGAFESVSLEWESTLGPGTSKSVAAGPSIGACLDTSPPPNSRAAMWSVAGSNVTESLFKIFFENASNGAIIDLWVDFVLSDATDSVATATATLSASQSAGLYTAALDGYTDGASAKLVPVGLATVTFGSRVNLLDVEPEAPAYEVIRRPIGKR